MKNQPSPRDALGPTGLPRGCGLVAREAESLQSQFCKQKGALPPLLELAPRSHQRWSCIPSGPGAESAGTLGV